MRNIVLLLGGLSSMMYAQRASGVLTVFSIPAGSCPKNSPLELYSPTVALYGCELATSGAATGTWTLLNANGGLTVGGTTISGGTSANVEYNNGGLLGEYSIQDRGNDMQWQ